MLLGTINVKINVDVVRGCPWWHIVRNKGVVCTSLKGIGLVHEIEKED